MSDDQHADYEPLPDRAQAVVLVAKTLERYGPMHGVTARRGRRFWRKPFVYEYVPMAREIVATLLLLPEGQRVSSNVLSQEGVRSDGSAHGE